MRRLWPILSFLPVLLIIAGFVLFTIEVGDPLQRVEKRPLVTGRVVAAPALRRLGPLATYVALHPGTGTEATSSPIDDALAEDDGTFTLRAERVYSGRFFLFVRVESTQLSFFCTRHPLPPVRVGPDREWEVAATGQPVPPVEIVVDAADRCGPGEDF